MSSGLLERNDEFLLGLAKPQLEPRALGSILQAGDAFVMCAGFEDRALGILDATVQAGTRGFKTIGINYLPQVDENRLEQARSICASGSIPFEAVTYDRVAPEHSGEVVAGLALSSQRIVVDVSGMSRLLIVQVLASLRLAFDRVTVAYVEADDYSPTLDEVQQEIADASHETSRGVEFISSGVFDLTIVQELSTTAMEGAPLHVVAFPTFNPSQFAALRSELQASSWTIVHGIPVRREYAWRPEAIGKINAIGSVAKRTEIETSTLDYRQTLDALMNVYRTHNESSRIIVAPTGSKMQAVAVGIARAHLDDLSVVYPTPRSFAARRYTTGIRSTYVLPLRAFTRPARDPLLK